MNFATETFVSNEIGKINFTIPENYVRNNVKTDFTYIPTVSGIDIATKTYVDDEVAKIPKITLPETMVKTDIENNFTVTPKINGTNIATTLDISNSISQIPQYNLPSNVVKNDTPTDFTVVPQINGKDITTKEYVDTEVSKVSYTLLNEEFEKRVKYTDIATDTTAGIITLNKVKEIAPKPDLSPYQLKTNFWIFSDPSLKVVGTNSSNGHSYAGWDIQMFSNTGEYTGAFHINGHNAFYKTPNRNGGNWNRLIDEHDLNNYVRDLRLSGYIIFAAYHHNAGVERNGYVVTGVIQNTNDNIIDSIQIRALQFFRNGQWLNVPFA